MFNFEGLEEAEADARLAGDSSDLFDVDSLDSLGGGAAPELLTRARAAGFLPAGGAEPLEIHRIFAMSDVHTDKSENMEFIKKMGGDHSRDLLILAGDVSHMMDVLRCTLSLLKTKFAEVFFTPGNHELWVKNDPDFKNTMACPYRNSFAKLLHILGMCDELGVRFRPRAFRSGGRVAWVAPVLSYHAQSFDVEADIDPRWQPVGRVEDGIQDYHQSIWPPGLAMGSDDLADAVDELNDEVVHGSQKLEGIANREAVAFREVVGASQEARQRAGVSLVTFSHFVPLTELTPEKRILFFPNLAKAIGSQALCRRVRAQLRPDLHVFGHTHFGWDQVVDGTRYVQAPLAMPRERSRLPTCAVGEFPDFDRPQPLLLCEDGTWATEYVAGWSEYYKRYPREPWLNKEIQADSHKFFEWEGKAAEKPKPEDCFPDGRVPGWDLAPEWVVVLIMKHIELEQKAIAERKAVAKAKAKAQGKAVAVGTRR